MNKQLAVSAKDSKYSFECVNCFEKPVGIIIDKFGKHYQNMFYLFLKLIQCYKIKGFVDSSFFYTIDYNEALKYVVEDVLGFHSRITIANVDTLHSVIKDYIDHDMYALVPGNLKKHCKTPYYKKNEWPHLFLVNGYDDEKEIYYVEDSNHAKGNNGECYTSMVMSYDFLESLYESAEESFQISSIWGIYTTPKKMRSIKELLLEFLDMYLNCVEKQPYYEVDYIEQINRVVIEGRETEYDENDYGIIKSIDFVFLRSIKYKELMYNQFIEILEHLEIERNIIEQIEAVKVSVLTNWYNVANKALVYKFLKQSIDLVDDVFDCIELEKKMYCQMIVLMDRLLRGY